MKTVSKMRRYVLTTVVLLTGLIASAQNAREPQQHECADPSVRWAGTLLDHDPSVTEGGKILGPPDAGFGGLPYLPGRALLGDFKKTLHYPGLSALLAKVTAGTSVTPSMLAEADVIAFEGNGSAPGYSGGWEGSHWTFSDGASSVSVYWDERVNAKPDSHVIANGSISGTDYWSFFGISPPVTNEVVSFLLFRLPEVNTTDAKFTIEATGDTEVPGQVEGTPEPDAIGVVSRSCQDHPPMQYAVKFICGKSDGGVVAPGTYFTAINVHNPADESIAFRKKFAVAFPGEKPGPVSRFFDAKLGPDEAFEIDCPDILRRTGTRGGFLKGFVVVESKPPLDIVAVYTAAGATGQVETLEIERVPGRPHSTERKPDLVPVPDPDPKIGFCRRHGSKLIVTVKNQGSADAGLSTTTVDFGAGGAPSQATPSIAAGASVDLMFDIPPHCLSPGECHFKITVDSNNVIDESQELNNIANGVCIG